MKTIKFAYYLPVVVKIKDKLDKNVVSWAKYYVFYGEIEILSSAILSNGVNGIKGVLAHEMQHLKIFARIPVINFIRSRWFEKVKYSNEVECFKEQLKFVPEMLDAFAYTLANNYGFNITKEQAKKDLEGR